MGKWTRSQWTADELIGGHPALDFLNTAGGSTKARDVERLTNYETALRWCAVAGVLTDDEIDGLAALAVATPEEAKDALGRLLDFREALHGCLMAEQAGEGWPSTAKTLVEKIICSTLADARLERTDNRFHWVVRVQPAGLTLILARLALSSEDLLRSDDLGRMRNCDRCSWLFIDRGRGRPRRWCSMAACGSRAKSARYYRRQKGNG